MQLVDWNDFFERTRVAAGAESFSKLAPMLGITDGAIGHYRQGRRVPQVWTVAEALKLQGHPAPEKAAIEIMKAAALTSTERTFWKRLAATAASLIFAIGICGHAGKAYAVSVSALPSSIATSSNAGKLYTLCEVVDWAGLGVAGTEIAASSAQPLPDRVEHGNSYPAPASTFPNSRALMSRSSKPAL
jgi:hypothetical protein